MGRPTRLRQLDPDDVLYRKVDPGQCDPRRGIVFRDAFIDHYDAQSFNVAKKMTPNQLLEKFGNMPGVKNAYKHKYHGRALTPQEMRREGFAVAAVKVSEIHALELAIKPDKDGSDFTQSGHVNIVGARDLAHEIAKKAKLVD